MKERFHFFLLAQVKLVNIVESSSPALPEARGQMVTELNFNSSFIKTPSKFPAGGARMFSGFSEF